MRPRNTKANPTADGRTDPEVNQITAHLRVIGRCAKRLTPDLTSPRLHPRHVAARTPPGRCRLV